MKEKSIGEATEIYFTYTYTGLIKPNYHHTKDIQICFFDRWFITLVTHLCVQCPYLGISLCMQNKLVDVNLNYVYVLPFKANRGTNQFYEWNKLYLDNIGLLLYIYNYLLVYHRSKYSITCK